MKNNINHKIDCEQTMDYVQCILCGGSIDRQLEYLIWEESESLFWLCQKCSAMFTAEPINPPSEPSIIPHSRN